MKKYILFAFSALLLAATSCIKFETETPHAVVNPTAPTVSVTETFEDENVGLTFTVQAAAGTGFYSYAVLKGDVAQVDPTNLLKVKCKGIVEGTVDYKAEPSKTVTVTGLSRNTTYTVLAVAASEQGTVGEVVTAKTTTADTQNPAIASFAVADSVVTVVFSEPVTLAANAEITAAYYAYNDPAFEEATPVATVEADMSKVVVSGNTATVEFAGIPHGAHYAVSFPEGTFVDVLGNKIPALQSAMIRDTETGETAGVGVYGRRDVVTFAFGELEIESLAEWTTPLVIDFGSEYGYGKTLKAASGIAEYVQANKVTSIDMIGKVHFDYVAQAGGVVVTLPEEPERGDDVLITIAADSFEDLYGNTNEEWSVTFVYSYGYTLEDILGTYSFTAASATYGIPHSDAAVVIAPDPEVENGIIVYDLFNSFTLIEAFLGSGTWTPAPYTVVEGTVDLHGGVVSLGSTIYLGDALYGGAAVNTYAYNFGDPILFQMPAVGTMNLASPVYAYLNGLGYLDYFESGTLTKVSDSYEYELPAAPTAVSKKKDAFNGVVFKSIER